jgi:GAF domain-containing protein
MEVTARFTRTLVNDYAIGDALHDLADDATAVLAVTGTGISLAHDGRLVFATAADKRITALERIQQETQQGACVDAYRSDEPVLIADLGCVSGRWPRLATGAADVGIVALAGIPMHLDGSRLGALGLYHDRPHDWTADVEAARLLAHMATAYVANAARLDQVRHTAEQLQEALDSRVITEQAKGILAGERNITVDEAFARLRSHARNNHVSLRAVADAVVNLRLRP